jgi:hypothetical protein
VRNGATEGRDIAKETGDKKTKQGTVTENREEDREAQNKRDK